MRLEQELRPGERVLWAATPDWRAKWHELAIAFLFASFWSAITGFFLVMMVAATLGYVPFTMNGVPASRWSAAGVLLFLVPFVAIGAAIFWYIVQELGSASRRLHAITDDRLLTVEIGKPEPTDDYDRQSVGFVRSTERADGSGTIAIDFGSGNGRCGTPRVGTLTWSGVSDVAAARAALDLRSLAFSGGPSDGRDGRVSPAALSALPRQLAQAAQRETRGERIDWIGRTDAREAAHWSMLVWIFALPSLYFVLDWELTSLSTPLRTLAGARTSAPVLGTVLLSVWGIPFVAVGLGMLGTPLWVYRRADETVYIVTDRRILTLRRRKGVICVATVDPSRIVSMSCHDRGGRGTVRMVLGKTTGSEGDVIDLVESLWLVGDAQRAAQLIEALRADGNRRAA